MARGSKRRKRPRAGWKRKRPITPRSRRGRPYSGSKTSRTPFYGRWVHPRFSDGQRDHSEREAMRRRFTVKECHQIRSLYSRGHKQHQIAKLFGCSQVAVSYVVRKKRHAVGKTQRSQRHARKLTIQQVREIRRKLKRTPHGDGKGLANDYGISQSMLSRIKSGECWNA